MMRQLQTFLAYRNAKQLRFDSRYDLEAFQQHKIMQFLAKLTRKSTYFKSYAGKPLSDFPLMDKPSMLQHFDQMNTAGLSLQQAYECALASEQSRDFKPTLKGITVGLSSGTSGQRGVFAVSAREAATWAGIMLAKTLHNGLFAGERVAFFLRANSNLYEAVQSRWLSYKFFDLLTRFTDHFAVLNQYQPSIIVAPAQVLRALALEKLAGRLLVNPKKVISVAEVLEAADRAIIARAFGQVHQVYQATEGFLASTCEQGTLHLNEEFVHIEPCWLDAEKTRFTPIITDFTRLTQPIVRYQLNDVLVIGNAPCACGRVTRTIAAIEGRQDDMLLLPGKRDKQEQIMLFADVVSRVIAQNLPLDADYQLNQPMYFNLELTANVDANNLNQLKIALIALFETYGVATHLLIWQLKSDLPAFDPSAKRRRIKGHSGIALIKAQI